jgi:ribosomal protein S18 acetylase RimI-like enzyme
MSEMLQQATKVALTAAIETNLYALLALWQRPGLASMALHDEADVMWLRSDRPHPMFNIVLGARFSAGSASDRIEATLDHFRPEGIPFSWWIGPLSEPADLDQKLEAHGLAHVTNNAGMAADLQAMDEISPAPVGLTIKRVSDGDTLHTYLQVMTGVFRMPAFAHGFWTGIFSSLGHDREAPMQHFVGYLASRPVACASVFLDGQVAGIYTVGVVIQARRQGIGQAITLAALNHARRTGYRYGILHASAAGLNVYRKLGFKEYCPISIYKWSGEEKG